MTNLKLSRGGQSADSGADPGFDSGSDSMASKSQNKNQNRLPAATSESLLGSRIDFQNRYRADISGHFPCIVNLLNYKSSNQSVNLTIPSTSFMFETLVVLPPSSQHPWLRAWSKGAKPITLALVLQPLVPENPKNYPPNLLTSMSKRRRLWRMMKIATVTKTKNQLWRMAFEAEALGSLKAQHRVNNLIYFLLSGGTTRHGQLRLHCRVGKTVHIGAGAYVLYLNPDRSADGPLLTVH